MSAYVTMQTPMTDVECLIDALIDLGFDRAQIETHSQPVQLPGNLDDGRTRTANIVVRPMRIGRSTNSLGFLASPTGFQATIYDRQQFNSTWFAHLNQRYHVHEEAKKSRLAAAAIRQFEEEKRKLVEAQRQAVHERAKKMGYRVEEKREGENLRLVLVKRTY
ncbi:MAG: hypothetical protein FWD57_04190 [Polyangiaceae bacterium]|nr:hypothetical protein [Polyangiaceae bacterium]